MSEPANLSALLGETGVDDAAAVSSMQLTADTMGPAIQAAFGEISIDDINTAEVVLVTILLDDSGSIRFAGNSQAVRDGHNSVIEALRGAKQSASVLVSCRYLNDSAGTDHGVLYPYRTLDGAVLLDSSNYDPRGGTPLYDQTAVTLTGVAAKMSQFEADGVAARAVTAIVTDGADEHSVQHRDPTDISKIVGGMLRTEAHIIAGMGIDDEGLVDFRKVFKEMGILEEWILTPGNTPSEIRKAFAVVSQSAVRASQAAGSGTFSQVALGGFEG